MIPKGLLIAVLTGVAASATIGVYLQSLSSHGIEFVQGPSVSIHVEKNDYKLGENVLIQIINSGTSELTFSDDMPSLRIRALDGTVFFSTSFDGLKLAPKEKHTFEWNQQKNDSSKIIEGRYVIDSFAYEQNDQKISDSITLTLLK
jgi:hypothetical protein